MFTTDDYDNWPDSFEQMRINRLRKQREREKYASRQLAFDFTARDYDPQHCACETQLRLCPGCYEKLTLEKTEAA